MKANVEIDGGRLEGWSDGVVSTFVGIPYGAPPVENRRFQRASQPKPWIGVRPATKWGPLAYQLGGPADYLWGAETSASQMSEDCLTLNVWHPINAADDPLPVLFWIHGGGFDAGTPSSIKTHGAKLAARGDVVVVSVVHRLNLFGYLCLSTLANNGFADSANIGNLDIVLALKWVRSNIAAFGGDAGNVTIFGMSGGSAKVGCLLAMPEARGLFQKAVMMSGARTTCPPLETAHEFALNLLRELQISESRWADLQQIRAEQLISAYRRLDSAWRRDLLEPGPVVDGVALKQDPIRAVQTGSAAKVPLMIGTTDNELHRFWINPRAPDSKTGAARPLYGPIRLQELESLLGPGGPDLISAYRSGGSPRPKTELAREVVTDWKFRVPSIRFAEAHLSGSQADVFVYLFKWCSRTYPEAGASHGLDSPFWFDTTDRVPATASDTSSVLLAKNMSTALVNFATTGKPAAQRLADWPRYDTTDRMTMVFDRESCLVSDPQRHRRQAWAAWPESKLGI